jgi:hypothetical protein
MTAKSYYMCMSVRGAIKDLQSRRGKKSYMNDDQGRPLTRLEAIDALMDELAKGHELIPMGDKCANPCPNAYRGCAGFDYKDGGCPGYCTESNDSNDTGALGDTGGTE